MTVIAETLPDPQPENPLAPLQAVFGYQQFLYRASSRSSSR